VPALPDEVRAQLSDALDAAFTPLLPIALGSIAAWLLLLWFVVAHTRPPAMGGRPASQDLGGEESPAVVSLMANRWRLTVDAVESTLLDLAARGHLELRQLGDDPRQTTIHLTDAAKPRKPPLELTEYENKVYDRVRRLSKGGVVPISALTFRDDGEAKSWSENFNHAVIREARAKGLSRSRLTPGLKRLLVVAALLPAVAVAAYVGPFEDEDPAGAMYTGGGITWIVLSALAARFPGERDTPAGREAAMRWAGLRRRLEDDRAFGDLPPAAVTVWDRYLPYGTAMGVNHVCSAVLDLGMGDRQLVWSSFGGHWHRVRVRYPRFWGRYGRPALSLGFWGLLTGVAGFGLLRQVPDIARAFADASTAFDPAREAETQGNYTTIRNVLLAVALLLLVRGAYRTVRTIVDVVAPRHLRGEVLWSEVWRTKSGKGENAPPEPWLYYVAVDDGGGDRTTAWGLPVELLREAVNGQTVELTVRPWSRRVLTMAKAGEGVADPVAPTGTTAP
jgi:hypothetical protein